MTKILVVGTGAIGGLYAAKLSKAGAEVSVLCRSDYEIVKRKGIEIKSLWGDFHFTPKNVLQNLCDYREKADFILVATKVLPEISLASLLAPVLHPQASIILIQNGIFIEKPVAEAFSDHHLISAIAFVDVVRENQGVIEHGGDGKLTIAEYQNPNQQKTEKLISLWQKAGVPCELVSDIQEERWKKLLWNASFNPISVLAGCLNTKEILDNFLLKNLVREAMKEVALLAKVEGYEISDELIEEKIIATHQRKNPAKTSMLIDFEAKRTMEVEAILGNAIRFAEEKNIATPTLRSFYALLSDR